MDTIQNIEEIKPSIERLYIMAQQKKEIDKAYNEERKKVQNKISNFMFVNLNREENSFQTTMDKNKRFREKPIDVKVTRVRTKKIIWDVDKLRKKLNKLDGYVRKQVINTKYTINDIDGLKKYLKKCGVNPRIFFSYLNTETTVNESNLENLSELGQIRKKDVKGCYTLQLGEPYIRITEQKEKEDAESL